MTNDGGRNFGQLNATCQFPFTIKGKYYYTCTYDYSFLTGGNPWCSVDTDDDNKHHAGRDRVVIDGVKKKFYGICDDTFACNIPPRRKFENYPNHNFERKIFLFLTPSL